MYDSGERFFTMAEAYDTMAPLLVPQYDFLQEEALNAASLGSHGEIHIADIGAGSGRLLEKVLERYPEARCWWVDYSEDFFNVAKRRLSKFGSRVQFLTARLEEGWEDSIPGDLDAIFSMSAIHHMESADKRALYGRCFAKLKPSGWFVNADEMKTVCADAYMDSMVFWWDYFQGKSEGAEAIDPRLFAKWREHFENWRLRNVVNAEKPKTAGDDMHDEFLKQLSWLMEIGFTNVDVFIKYRLWCVIGGKKPA